MKGKVKHRMPTAEEYKTLCRAVGWEGVINFHAVEQSLAHSVYGVVAEDERGKPVGMGRIVGDGAIYFYIQDVLVVPDAQGWGLGTALLGALTQWLAEEAPPQAFIGLFAAPGTEDLYRRFSLDKRDLTGLFTVKELLPGSGESPGGGISSGSAWRRRRP